MSDVILRGIVGSTAYGLAHADSDVDRLGIFVAPTRRFLGWGLSKADETRRNAGPDPHDSVEHEVGKFLRLALKGNPTIMELLWLSEYEVLTPAGQALVDRRDLFLGRRSIASAYGGYAHEQARRLRDRGRFKDVPVNRIEKHGRHCARLLIQARDLLDTGVLTVRLPPAAAQYVHSLGRTAVHEVEGYMAHVDALRRDVDASAESSTLPDKPDPHVVEDFLVHLRRTWPRCDRA